MLLFNISTEHKLFIKKTQKPVFVISVRYNCTLSYLILIKNKKCPKVLQAIDRCTI
jgi:hypothetical protein